MKQGRMTAAEFRARYASGEPERRSRRGKARGRVLEKDIQKAIIQIAKLEFSLTLHRRNVAAFEAQDSRGRKRFVRCGQTGMADLHGTLPGGRRIEVEVKRPGNTPSAAQAEWLRTQRALGAVAFWADSVDSFREQMREATKGDQNP